MKLLMRSLLLLAATLAVCAPAGAAAPKLLHHQAKVLDANHQPLAGVVVERYQLPGFFARADLNFQLEERVTSDSTGSVSFTATNSGLFVLFARKPGLSVGWSLWLPGFPVAELGGTGELVLTAPVAVSGVVKDAAGRPVPEAQVWVHAAFTRGNQEGGLALSSQLGRRFLATRTGPKGEFRIEGLPTGASLDLAAAKPGLAIEQLPGTAFGPGNLPFQAGQSDIVLTLKPAGALAGQVVREDSGAPLAGARVSLAGNEWNQTEPELASAQTGADGRFLLPDLAPGEYKLRALIGTNAFADWVCEEGTATVQAGTTNRDLKLNASRGGVLEVTLRDANQQPITDAVVGVSRGEYNQLGALSETGIARFRLVPGNYHVFAFGEGLNPHQDQATIAQNETNRVEIQLEAAPRLSGVVLAPNGQPAPHVKVLLLPQLPAEQQTDAQGRFTLTLSQFGEGPEQQRFILARDLAHNLAAIVDVEENATNFTLRLQPALTVTGSITDEQGKPVTNATAQAIFRTERIRVSLGVPVPVDAQGRFELPALATGQSYLVNVSAKGFGQEQREIQSGETATNHLALAPLQLPRADRRLAGRVVDADDKPVPGAWVNGNGEHQPSLSGRTDAQGRFSFDHVCAGTIQISANNRHGGFGNVKVEAGDTNVTVQLGVTHGFANMNGSAKLTGVVRTPEGKPAAKALVSMFFYGGSETEANAEGRFKLSYDPGQWNGQREVPRLVIARDLANNLAAAQEIEAETTNADVKLEPALTLVGRVTDSAGKPLPNATAQVMLHAGNFGSSLGSSIHADAAGRFEFKALPVGQRYSVTVAAKGYGQERRSVEPTEGSTRKVELEPAKLQLANQRLAGVVLDNDDQPVANASLYCYEDKQPNLDGRTDSKGRFAFDHVCPGRIRLSVNAQNKGYANVTAEGGDTNVVIHLGANSGGRVAAPSLARLQGKPLPDLAPLGVAAADCPKDQPILAVLIDAEQRPSRRLLHLVTDQAAALKQKGVAVVVLQAGSMTAEAFAAWKQTMALPFPVGCLKGEPEKARAAWGAGALPWLILTDKNHRVMAEGFSLEELDTKLATASK